MHPVINCCIDTFVSIKYYSMRKLSIFNFISLNGYFKGPADDTGWHRHGEEENSYSHTMLAADSILIFGRKTYEMMLGFWPTAIGENYDPVTAKGMNEAEKIVFSNTLKHAEWHNSQVLKGDIVEQIKAMKNTAGKDLAVLGSGSIVSLFAEHGLIDEYQLMIDPVALTGGTPAFQGITHNLELQLTDTRVFKSGTVLLCYQPLGK
jgi:dihydrofolate reductase